MADRKVADKIVRSHVIWSMGAGLIPVPLFDLAAVTAIQIDLLKQLADPPPWNIKTSGNFCTSPFGSEGAHL